MIKAKIKREPVMTAATITAVVTAIIVLVTSFGVDITPEQQAAIITVSVIAVPLLLNLAARARVTPWEPDQ